MPRSSFDKITQLLSLEETSLAVPFLRLPSLFHRKANGIYIYKMGTKDEVSLHMPKAPRDCDDFFDLAMAVSKHKLYHGQYVFVAHDIKMEMEQHEGEDRYILERVNNLIYKSEIDYRKTMTAAEESYQVKTKILYTKFEATPDTDEAIKSFRVAHDSARDEKERLITNAKVKRDLEVHRFYEALEHILNHSDVNKAKYTQDKWYMKSEQDFVEKFKEFGLHEDALINEMRIVAMEKILQKKTHRFVENLLIDAAIAGHKTAHQHIKLVELNCQDGVKLKMVKRFSTIEEMKMLVWDLQKYGASSTYYWLNNPQQVNDLQQGLRRLIDAHEQRCETEQMLKASQRVLSEVDLRKLTIPDDDEEVNEEIANLALSQSSVMIERSETAAEASQPPVLSPAESSQRPRSMF